MIILVKGVKGEQHKIFQFKEGDEKKHKNPRFVTNRAGNTYLEFNQDWHIRELDEIFLIQTDSKAVCTAKPLSFTDKSEVPMVTLKNASKELRKDVWIMKVKEKDELLTTPAFCARKLFGENLHMNPSNMMAHGVPVVGSSAVLAIHTLVCLETAFQERGHGVASRINSFN